MDILAWLLIPGLLIALFIRWLGRSEAKYAHQQRDRTLVGVPGSAQLCVQCREENDRQASRCIYCGASLLGMVSEASGSAERADRVASRDRGTGDDAREAAAKTELRQPLRAVPGRVRRRAPCRDRPRLAPPTGKSAVQGRVAPITSSEPGIVTLSVRLYETLLRAYPRRFRRDYEIDMVQVFHDCCRGAYATRGARGLPSVWVRSVLDLVANAPQERLIELATPPPTVPRTLTRCTFCREEIIGPGEKCLYCGAPLTLPLSTATVPRPAEHQGRFTEDTPRSSIRGGPPC
jgi:hypothetical protein